MKRLAATILAVFAAMAFARVEAIGQIFDPEGMNLPGQWDAQGLTWNNPPNKLAFAGIERAGGTFLLDSLLLTRRYHTLIHIGLVGADTSGGTYNYLFTSGPTGTPYLNKWAGVTTSINTVQLYSYNTGADNSVTLVNDNYYTVNYQDNGYTDTKAIWLSTATAPVAITSLAQSPPGGTISPSTPVNITINLSSGKPADQTLYLRYTTDNFASSTLVTASLGGNFDQYTASIPGQVGGTNVKYYALTSPSAVGTPSTDTDLKTLQYNNNAGAFYGYNVPAPTVTITASAGAHGTITPSGSVVVTSGHDTTFTFAPDAGYFVDSIIVDNLFAGDSSSYTFHNVTINHTIRVTFNHRVNVTFQVNLAQKIREAAFFPDSDQVTVRGTFNDWGNSTNNPDTLHAAPGDSVYRLVKPLAAGVGIEYKFWKSDRAGMGYENDIPNRATPVDDTAFTLPVTYFDKDAPPFSVTFQVNMGIQMQKGNFRLDSGDVVELRGDFNNWGSPTPDTMTDLNHDSIYTVTVGIKGEQTVQYKFWKTLRGGLDYELDIPNRTLSMGLAPQVLSPAFFDNDQNVQSVMTVGNGWNMISLPRLVPDPRKTTLFPTAISNAFGYNGTYVITDSLQPGSGYWLKFASGDTFTINGNSLVANSINVVNGWNMIGGLSNAIAVSSITSNPSGILTGSTFGYKDGYTSVDSLHPGAGYWVKVTQDGTLNLVSSSSVPKPGASDASDRLSRVTLRDALGRSQTLFVGGHEDRTLSARYELPPPPPADAFDARFGSNSGLAIAPAAGSADFPITMRGARYPVTVSWEIRSQDGLSLKVSGRSTAMRGSGSVRIVDPDAKVTLTAGERGLPQEFALGQNYPNPFNPTTVINYALPVDAHVTLSIYNDLGQKIATLVDGVKSAGYQSVQWDALNGHGAPVGSGVYFYVIKATSTAGSTPSFTQVKKMMLIR